MLNNINEQRSIHTSYFISQCIRKIERKKLFIKHPLYNSSVLWNNETKSNLITTVLNDYLIPSIVVVGKIINNTEYQYIIDGTQRITTFLEFKNNELEISDQSNKYIVKYQTAYKDKNDEIANEIKEFDLRGKYYKDLPEELQDIFDDYNINVDLYPCSSDEDILFHIQRYHIVK